MHTWVRLYMYHPLMFLGVRMERARVLNGTGAIMFLAEQYTRALNHTHP